MERKYKSTDRFIIALDQGLRTLYGKPESTGRESPAQDIPESVQAKNDQRRVAGLMRVNHAGEIAAQALYYGQALTTENEHTRAALLNAAREEGDHLEWCQQRLSELNSHISYLGPIWYLGSLTIGAMAGARGDAFSLGFVAETEHQVSTHLSNHLQRLPQEDSRSRQILLQMREDEEGHANQALESGGKRLPWIVRRTMKMTAKVMTTLAYRI
ncbi:MAG TPA: demethoxyubiquinone hydroxylase family protein [Gammaproteobacteria bacterium]|nr:demethoxyubiquinone hydroxylase family protein [Gammaproteobacteria bacterium]